MEYATQILDVSQYKDIVIQIALTNKTRVSIFVIPMGNKELPDTVYFSTNAWEKYVHKLATRGKTNQPGDIIKRARSVLQEELDKCEVEDANHK